jgi:hypothetical protein
MAKIEKEGDSPEKGIFLRFGQFLTSRDIVTEDDVIEALNIQKERTTPIGKIALKENMLTIKQVFTVLNEQINNPKMFGEIAVELGFLQEGQIAKLLQKQRELRPPIGEILVEMNRMSAEILYRELRAFHEYLHEEEILRLQSLGKKKDS